MRDNAPPELLAQDDEIDAIKAKTDQLAFTGGNVHNRTKAQDDLPLTPQQKLDVNVEAKDVFFTDTIPEIAQGVPPLNPTPAEALMHPYMQNRNEGIADNNTGLKETKNSAGVVTSKKTFSDVAGVYKELKAVSGP